MEATFKKNITMRTSHEPATAYSSEKSETSENIFQGYGINFKKNITDWDQNIFGTINN